MKISDVFYVEKKYYSIIQKKLNNCSENEKIRLLEQITLYNRINTLSSIFNAKHGWLGASYSIAEILTYLYFDKMKLDKDNYLENDFLILSKGHAAVMQYSCLAGIGEIQITDLNDYKKKNGPQAHTDINTSGIISNTGSLGQSLSKASGLSLNSKNKIYVILGDGELQEGQNFEAFMTINHYNLKNVITIVDKNNIQSDSNVKDIKQLYNMKQVFEGFGFEVLEINGNDLFEIDKLFMNLKFEKPVLIIANTSKGAGLSFSEKNTTERRRYSWHSKIPNKNEYYDALFEFCNKIENTELKINLQNFLHDFNFVAKENVDGENNNLSTGQTFSRELLKFVEQNKDIFVLDADLEKSCKLTEIALKKPGNFIEIGISEQDMVSFAGGLALKKKLPVVNTYANFYRRAFEQIYVNSTEKTKIIYAGHYSGLCYTTDGKTHQATGDISMMRSIPNMIVLYPAFNEELSQMLNWYINADLNSPLYLKLHRTAAFDLRYSEKIKFDYGFGKSMIENNSDTCVISCGPHITSFCYNVISKQNEYDLHYISTMKNLNLDYVRKLVDSYGKLIVIEENINSGGLFDEINLCLSEIYKLIPNKRIQVISKAVDNYTFSTRKPLGLYEHFQLSEKDIQNYLF